MDNIIIIEFMLPSTFPEWMMPEETGLFILSLVGKPLFEAQFLATARGLMPTIKTMPDRGADWRLFSITDNGLGIPLACRVNSTQENPDAI